MNDLKNSSKAVFSNKDTVQILSLDGGGLKGLYTISVLASLEKQLGKPIADHFDFITGTSTGGLIALGLGLRIPCDKIQQFYQEHGHRIFPNSGLFEKFYRFGRFFFTSKYQNDYLEQQLKQLLTLTEINTPLLGSSHSRIIIPTFKAGESKPRLLKTPHGERYRMDWRMPMWAVGMATTAAPLYLPPFKYEGQSYIDGGVWANNPSLIGVVEALDMGASLKNIKVLNIGTTFSLSNCSRTQFFKLKRSGLFTWALSILPIVMQANSSSMSDMYLHQLLEKGNLKVVNKQTNIGEFSLDDIDNDTFIEMGTTSGEREFSDIEKTFFGHRPKAYKPNSEAMNEDEYRAEITKHN